MFIEIIDKYLTKVLKYIALGIFIVGLISGVLIGWMFL